MADTFLLFSASDKDNVSKEVIPLFSDTLLPVIWPSVEPITLTPDCRVFVYISDTHIPAIIDAAVAHQWQLAILPHPEAGHACRGFGIPKQLENAIQLACDAKPLHVDVLRCNGSVVLDTVILGRGSIFGLNRQNLNWQEKLKKVFVNLSKVKTFIPAKFTITTESENTVETAAIGTLIISHAHGTALSRNILSTSSVNDGMCHAIVLAPHSIMELVRLFIMAPFRRDPRLPGLLGFIKSRTLMLCVQNPMTFVQDGIESTAQELIIETTPRSLCILGGEPLPISDNPGSSKESRKIVNLPAGGAIAAMIDKPLPFITHAATDEFRELYQLLRENASATPSFLTLMVLSTLLASIGLFASSAPVIIGAMILAPLMAPIISLAMALVRQDTSLLSASSQTLLTGLLMATSFAALASFILPMEIVTPEIQARLSPNLLDLGVAVISGIAGAYAHARIDASKSLAGVAIAVALVPPLAVTGIGIGWADLHVAWGALLLFLTNLAGIVLSASVTFLMLGFAPFTRAKKGLAVALLAVFIVSVPLLISFVHLSHEAKIIKALEGLTINQVVLRQVSARDVKPLELSLEIMTPHALSEQALDNIKQAIEQELQTPVILEATLVIRRE